MFWRTMTAVMFIALVMTGAWGYRQYQQKQSLLMKTESQYQRAFHDLASHMDLLQDELGKTLAMNSPEQLIPSFTNVWRLSSSAQADVGQLPFTLMPFNKTQEFLQNIGNYTYRIAVRGQQTAQKSALTQTEWEQLHRLYVESNDVEQALHKLQTAVIDQHLRWTDAETALSQQKQKADNQIVDGFRTIDDKVSQFPEMQSPTMEVQKSRNRPRIHNLTGETISPEQAAKRVASFLARNSTEGIHIQNNGQGTSYPSYSVTVDKTNGDKLYMGQTVKGGHIVWMMDARAVGPQQLDLLQAADKAQRWLGQRGFRPLTLVKTNQYDNVGVFSFVYQQGNVTVYPDTVTVKVALDNGEVIGFNDQDWLFHHKQRTLSTPKLSRQQARQFVSPHLQVQEQRLAVIENDVGEEKMVWEVMGTIDENTYRVFVDANTGQEIEVEKLKSVS